MFGKFEYYGLAGWLARFVFPASCAFSAVYVGGFAFSEMYSHQKNTASIAENARSASYDNVRTMPNGDVCM
jgi:hypothetical protein